jgi:hypothetical protein
LKRTQPLWLAGLCALALALLVGCGAASAPSGAAGGGTATPSPTNPAGAAARPCPGGSADALVDGTPALILTEQSNTGSAHVGDLIQVRLTQTNHWSFAGGSPALAPTQHAGDADQARGICFWNFQARSATSDTLHFTGTALCDVGRPCPMYARDAHFTITIA